MQLSVLHTTRYDYQSPVSDSFNDAHLCPVSDDFQVCEQFELKIDPGPVGVLRRLDFYTNQVHHFEILQAHAHLEVAAYSVVTTYTDTRNVAVFSDPKSLAGLVMDERYYDFLHRSERVSLSTPVLHSVRQLELTGDVRERVERIMSHIFENFTYSPGATQVETPVERVLDLKQGVCQDFAHVMIAFCRAEGIPARYVSGYFYTERCGAGTLDDNSASHAWVECYLPGIGWVGYDPTHNRQVSEIYIKVASGRDYVDVRPLAGTYRGASTAELSVDVKVMRLDNNS